MAVSSIRWSPCGQTENVIDEHGLAGDVAFRYPPHLPLTNHVHCFDPLKCSPGRVESYRPTLNERLERELWSGMVHLIPLRRADEADVRFGGR